MAVAFGVMVIEGSTLGALSYLLKPLFDKVFSEGGQDALIWVGFAILGLFVLRAITSITSKSLLTTIAQRSSSAMQVDLLRHILTLDAGFFQSNPPGALIERVQGDTAAVQGVWSTLITGVGRDVISLIGLFAVALAVDPTWTVAALIGAPLLILPALVIQRYIRRKTAAMRIDAGQRATRLDEVFHGIQAVKLNRMEEYQTGRFKTIVNTIVRAEIKMMIGRSTLPALIDVITGIGFFTVLMLGGAQIADGTRTIGDFMAFFSAMALTFQPLRRLGDMAGFWQVAAASLERLFRLFDTQPTPRPDAIATLPNAGQAPRIEVRDVVFGYGDVPVLHGLSLVAEAGKMTALVGASGAGKSTVFNLLTAMATPQDGKITLDGTDIATLPLPALRSQFAVVTQDAALFDETIRENIALGSNPTETQLRAAMDAAHVSEFVDGLPLGLDSPAGPRGSALSGGQRQRVAIARALLRDAPVLLLDEATSALDAQSEALVAEALSEASKGRTTLVIAHRLATIRNADRIVVMDAGRAVDSGTHEELLARSGLYADLCKLQFQS
ncbi:ATP-binding cassette domain-containing protein [Pseudorhodobacter turbinis]|uniref:ATP-binding cassette domain-containing protein n=1 Tax=Pseudorhodobacter turbinis TaxID=2500533 RepID=A0A4P8EIJ2_9RHOB|nr:ABC transporter transmembrane domain-containing protein [Pseudorhodobacter turbinis]QCO56485.1 ATP-binding cassette domain-containing protein [Pseudorhodobacter turbinis]